MKDAYKMKYNMEYYELNHEATLDDIKRFNYSNQKIGVIAHIEDNSGKILLQQRGIKSRDENGLYEDIGGEVEPEDLNFKSAIIREIKEEAGDEINLSINDSIAIYHCYKNNINWIMIIYFVKYIDGKIKIMEPEKCIGYKFFEFDELINSDNVSESCKYLSKKIKQKYNK